MKTITFDEAVRLIARKARDCKDREQSYPYAFVVGAGISHPTVPLAGQIEEHCKEKAALEGHQGMPANDSPMERYSYWFEAAYPNLGDRQHYLAGLIENKPIPLAPFRLAHLLMSNTVAGTVVTPNFDDFLSRALTILGQYRFHVCDHPRTVERIDETSKSIQIVHVHGTYWYYDLANLKGDIESRAAPEQSTAFSMVQLLDSIFRRHSPLVVGYNGWDGDVIMTALRRRLANRLENRMYWFCYRRDSPNLLPEWLMGNPDVWFVLPPEAALGGGRLQSSVPPLSPLTRRPTSQAEEKVSLEKAPPVAGPGHEPSLEARVVFERLTEELNLGAPPLVRDPLGFFAEQLQGSVHPEEGSSQTGAAYSFQSVIRRIKRAQELEQRDARAQDAMLESVRDALRRSAYDDALQNASRVNFNDLDPAELRELVDGLSLAVSGSRMADEPRLDWLIRLVALYDQIARIAPEPRDTSTVSRLLILQTISFDHLGRHEEEVAVYDDVVRRFGDSPEPELREQVAKALFNKGVTLGHLGRNEDEVAVYDDVVRRFGDSAEPRLRVRVAKALVNKAVRLGRLGRNEDEVAVYDDVLRRFGDSAEPELREWVATALFNKGVTLGHLGRNEDAVAVYDDVVRRFGDSAEPELREPVAKALVNKGVILGRLGRNEDEVAVYDDVVRRFGDSPEPELREWVATALVNKGITLGQLDRNEDAVAVYDDVVRRFGDSPEPELREHVAGALFNKGVRLGRLGRNEDEVAVYDDVVRRFGDSPEPELREWVATALVNKGVTLGQLGRNEDAVAVCDDVVRRFGDSPEPELREQVARALVNKGVTLGQLGRNEDAVAVCDDVVRRFGDSPDASLRGIVDLARTAKANLSRPRNQEAGPGTS